MDVGFLILSPDRNIAGLKNTLGSIKYNSYNRESICVVGNDANDNDIKEMSMLCPTYKGEDTITSLVNLGMEAIKNEWAFIVFGGSRLPRSIEKKWDSFCKADTTILFPVVDSKYNFVDGSFNGVLINKAFFKKVGDFPTNTMQKYGLNDFEFAKMLWTIDAINHKAEFKAIVGMRII
jgi:hypothetical protein